MSLILSGTNGLSDVDGTAATPAIRGTDTNTGIFFPAADTVAASVGGTEGLRLTTTGLGVGTSTPAAKLQVGDGTATTEIRIDGDGGSGNGGFIRGYKDTANPSWFVGDLNPIAGGANSGLCLYSYGATPQVFYTNGTERLRLDSSGNLGLGVTPSAWVSARAIDLGSWGSLSTDTATSGVVNIAYNAYALSASSWRYKNTYLATRYAQEDGLHKWFTAPSGTAGNAISFTQAMTLDASGNLGINSTSPSTFGKVTVQVDGTTTPTNLTNVGPSSINLYAAANGGSTNSTMGIFGWNATTGIGSGIGFVRENGSDWGTQIRFYTHPTTTSNIGDITERARITSGGDLLVGVTAGTGSWHHITKGSGQGQEILSVIGSQAGSQAGTVFFGSNTITANTAATVIRAERNSSTSRSINAGGTINASGADYAEYMTKAGDFTIAKGDVCGIDANGKLTNVFADAVSFCVKSTDPSYVGGDSWGAGFEDDAEGLEAARQKVDRIAFAGQVPVNVMGATPGQYIVPVNDNGAIKGIPKNEADMTLAEYMKAVGKVIATQADGRAFIIVKVA